MVAELMQGSRPPADLATYILREIKNKTFYILPDKEVKDYCLQRTEAIINESMPHEHSVEKIVVSLSKRVTA